MDEFTPLHDPDAFTLTRLKAEAWLRARRGQTWRSTAPHPVLAEALGDFAGDRSDIHDHLPTIFLEAVRAQPKLIVELGTRGGLSTRALLAAAEVADAQMLSVDIEDCAGVEVPERMRPRWTFVMSDDVAFAAEPFATFCAERGLAAQAQAIFVDTSHRYDHTKAELAAWLPRLAPGGVMMFHDTNLRRWFRRLDGRIALGWNNRRGVIRAIEEQLGRAWDEQSQFVDVAAGFLVRHAPWCNGFTVLQRMD
jgi:predicted O-methyltransferase YrrM